MRYRIMLLCIVLLCLAGNTSAQRNRSKDNRPYVLAPSENVLLVIASQPGCPVTLDEAKLWLGTDGKGLAVSYKLRNTGTKSIRYLTPIMWTSFGTGGTLAGSGPSSGSAEAESLAPGDTISEAAPEQLVPLTPDLREALRLQGPMKAMVVLMIQSITFDDGTSYSDEPTSKALLSYFQDLSDNMETLESLKRLRK